MSDHREEEMKRRTEARVDLLRELVAVDSQSPVPGEVAIAGLVQDYCREIGFESEVIESVPGRTSVLASFDAGPGPSLGLCGHLDTKAMGESATLWSTPPHQLVIEGGRAYGLGTTDMKGAIVAMLRAAQCWAEDARGGRLDLIFTADEETGGQHGARYLADQGLIRSEAVVVGEPSCGANAWDTIFTVSRGAAKFEVEVTGQTGHSGLSELLPTSATVAAAHILVALDTHLAHVLRERQELPHPVTVNAGVMVSGGRGYGVHPGLARIACEVRVPPGLTMPSLREAVSTIAHNAAPADVGVDVKFLPGVAGWKDAGQISSAHPLCAVAAEAVAVVGGRNPTHGVYPGGTDASWFAFAGTPAIAALGPGDLSIAHQPDEFVELVEIEQAEEIYLEIAKRYLGQAGEPST